MWGVDTFPPSQRSLECSFASNYRAPGHVFGTPVVTMRLPFGFFKDVPMCVCGVRFVVPELGQSDEN